MAAHDVGWVVCSFFTIIACAVSFWLINKHLMWYTNVRLRSSCLAAYSNPAQKKEQRCLFPSHFRAAPAALTLA
jgi:hypothetical protein